MALINDPITPPIEVSRSRQWDMSPTFLSLDSSTIDLKSAANTQYASPYLDLKGFFNYKMFVDVTADTIGAGAFKVTFEEYTYDGSTFTLLDSEDILTAIDSTTDGQKEILLFGSTIDSDGILYSSGGGTAATKGGNLNKYQMVFIGRLVVEVTTQATGTSGSADVRFLAGD